MTLHLWVTLISIIGTWIQLVYMGTGVLLWIARIFHRDVKDGIRKTFRVVKYPTIIGIYLQPVFSIILDGHLGWTDMFAFAMGVWNWYTFKNEDDDDSWKKLLEKLKEKVTQIGSRLVVVPETA